ncbi:MAG: DUF502 domain-containing protein [Planctomycetia bacterium]|nr:DUF502 domain-containing protein [Planctomycetia bacterium]
MLRYFGKLFLTGLVFLLPFIVTALVVVWSVGFLTGYLGPNTTIGSWLGSVGLTFSGQDSGSYIFGWCAVLALITATGWLIESSAKHWIVDRTDSLMKKIPIVGLLYGATRQFANLLQKSDNTELQNMSPVYCRFGDTLFLALMPVADEFVVEGKKYREVIIPTAPVPFGGAVILVPSQDVWDAKISVEQLLSFYVSMGVTAREYIEVASPSKNEKPAEDEKTNETEERVVEKTNKVEEVKESRQSQGAKKRGSERRRGRRGRRGA